MSRKTMWCARLLLSAVFFIGGLFLYAQGNAYLAQGLALPPEQPGAELLRPAPPERPAEGAPEPESPEPESPPEPISYDGCRLPILMYHHVVAEGEPCNEMTVTVTRLDEDLHWLTENGYHTVLPRELSAGQPLPDKPVLLTFDDGYRSNYELAYPLLQAHGAKAVISVIVYMQDVSASSFLSWEMCREMSRSGLVEIGSHTYLLHNLDGRGGRFSPYGINGIQRRPAESDGDFQIRVLDDIRKSRGRLEEKLGRPVTFFAYPYGIVEPDAEELIDALFPVTVVTKRGTAELTDGLQQLPRWTVGMKTELNSVLP